MPKSFHNVSSNSSANSSRNYGKKFNRNFSPNGPMNIHLFLLVFEKFYKKKNEAELRTKIFYCLNDTTLAITLPVIGNNASYLKFKKVLIKTFGSAKQLKNDKDNFMNNTKVKMKD